MTNRLAQPVSRSTVKSTFPTIRVAGLFLIAVGLTTLVALLLRGSLPLHPGLFIAGMLGAGFGILMNPWMRNHFSDGIQNSRQRWAIRGAIAFEAIGILVVCQVVAIDLQTRWLWLFVIVGLHFMPLQLSHSRWVGLLGVLLMANAIAGLLSVLPFWAVAVLDGLLKLVFGLTLFFTPIGHGNTKV